MGAGRRVRAAWRGARRDLQAMPWALKLGLAVFAAGAAVDLAYHALLWPWAGSLAWLGEAGHLVTLLGMAVTVAGLLVVAARPVPSPRGKERRADASNPRDERS
ncbi:MAG: hypothetical protein IRY97_02530 [Thermomicrobiaceae bacterium]|nr:hypothetical protein [Thermomicrobiaceae bacterium]